jgi:hypothetical protein
MRPLRCITLRERNRSQQAETPAVLLTSGRGFSPRLARSLAGRICSREHDANRKGLKWRGQEKPGRARATPKPVAELKAASIKSSSGFMGREPVSAPLGEACYPVTTRRCATASSLARGNHRRRARHLSSLSPGQCACDRGRWRRLRRRRDDSAEG